VIESFIPICDQYNNIGFGSPKGSAMPKQYFSGCVPRATVFGAHGIPRYISLLTAKWNQVCIASCRSFRCCSEKMLMASNRQVSVKHSSCNHSSFQRGFTLIELLVVLVVMGVAMGLVVVQLMPDHQAPLREEAARLALLMENAGLEARASGRSMAWSGEKNSYRFFSKNAYGDWVRIDDDSSFRPRTLPEGVNVGEVSVEEQVIKPGEYILLSANSFAVPFRIRLSSEFGGASVTGKSTGDVISSLDGRQAVDSEP
jgi:general secretion pathway protein H